MPRPFWLFPLWEHREISLGGYTVITNMASVYDGNNMQRGLGRCRIDFTNVASILFSVSVNKIGTGTHSWQLWNETDGTQIGVIDDTGAAGNKTLSTTITSGIPAGIKDIRVRAKSTVSTDDPVYYGAYLFLT